jgi:hypothetical protein
MRYTLAHKLFDDVIPLPIFAIAPCGLIMYKTERGRGGRGEGKVHRKLRRNKGRYITKYLEEESEQVSSSAGEAN